MVIVVSDHIGGADDGTAQRRHRLAPVLGGAKQVEPSACWPGHAFHARRNVPPPRADSFSAMRMSRTFGATLRAAPARRKLLGQQLLHRGGFVRQLGQGIFSYLPLGWRVLRRIESIMRDEMDAAGGVEISLPLVHPADIWRASGRWDAVGPELARFKDRRERDLVLAMTHEEVVATLAASEIGSWRDSSSARLPDPAQVSRRPAASSRPDSCTSSSP